MFGKLFGRKAESVTGLTPEADAFLARALEEFNAKQESLRSAWRIGTERNWSLDQSEGVLRLDFENGQRLEADAQILGSYSKDESSWEWAWNNPNVHRPMKAASLEVRSLGRKLRIDYLQSGKIPVPGEEFLSYLCAIGLKATDSMGVFRGKAGAIDVLLMLKNLRWK